MGARIKSLRKMKDEEKVFPLLHGEATRETTEKATAADYNVESKIGKLKLEI